MSAADLQREFDRIVADTGCRFTRDDLTAVQARLYAVRDLPHGDIVIIARPMDPIYQRGWEGRITDWEKTGKGLTLTRPSRGPILVYPLGDVDPAIIADGRAATYTYDDAKAEADTVPLEAW